MPSASRFALLRDTVRSHPVVVASTAASAGVLLGGFVAFQLLAPVHPRADSATATPAAISAKGEAKPAPATTGSAPASERTASADCDNETWPHLSPPCVEEMRNKNRTRVISTDKLDKPAVTAIEAAPPEAKPAAPLVANTTAVASPSPSSSPPVDLAAAPSAVFATPETSPAAVTSAVPQPTQPSAEPEPKKEKRVATKSKRKPKSEAKTIPAKQESDDDDDAPSTTASAVVSRDSDDRVSERRVDRRRIVERWTERDYDVTASNGDGSRRVTVIRRSGGGLFEGLFGD
jgi:hypothetical protein